MNTIGYIHQPEYESQFWNMARHRATRIDSLSGGYNTTNSTYTLPSASGTKLEQALSRESLEMERDGRILILNSTALIPIYLPDINQFCAYGFILPSPISVGTGTASRIIYLLLNEPGKHGQQEASDPYPPFICGILRHVEQNQRSGTLQTEKEDDGNL